MSDKKGQTPQASSSTYQSQPAPIINYIQLSPQDLQQLIAGVQTRATGGDKNLKFADQKPFTGKVEDLEALLRDAEIRFGIQSTTYDTPEKQAYYVLSLFQTGVAQTWKEQYI